MDRAEPIFAPMSPVKRPWLVALLAVLCTAAAGAAIIGLAGVSYMLRLRPQTLLYETASLGEALDESPWIETGGAGPIVWAVLPPRCPQCANFFHRDLPALEADGLRVRVILYAPRDERDARLAAWVAEAARVRRADQLAWLKADADMPAVQGRDAAEREGYLEWGRAARDRLAAIIAANGATMEAPVLFWRRGPEWRVDLGPDHLRAAHARRELAAGV
ncbi:MAG: hypothetical protein AB7O04_00475 [Hyphomonadaceae bacterium]